MTRDEQIEPVRAVGAGHRAHGGRCPNLLCDPLVTDRLPKGYFLQLAPDAFLKRRAAQRERNGESFATTAEILQQLLTQLLQDRVVPRRHWQLESAAHFRITLFQTAPVGEFKLAEGFITGCREHRTEWRVEQRDTEMVAAADLAGRMPKRASERRAKTAVRLKTMVEHHIIHRRARTDLREGP